MALSVSCRGSRGGPLAFPLPAAFGGAEETNKVGLERLEVYNHLQLSCFREALRNSGIKRCLYVLSMVEYSKYDADC